MRKPLPSLRRRPQPDRCSVCGATPVVMSGYARDVYQGDVPLGACDQHNRRVDYALYLLADGPRGEIVASWIDQQISNIRIDRKVQDGFDPM